MAQNIGRFLCVCIAGGLVIAIAADGVDALTWNPIGLALTLLVDVLAVLVGLALFSPVLLGWLAFDLVLLWLAGGRGGRPFALAVAVAPLLALERDDWFVYGVFAVASVVWGFVVELPVRRMRMWAAPTRSA